LNHEIHEKLFSRVEHEERVEVLDRINRIGHWTGSGSGRLNCRDDECVANIYSETYTEGSDPLEPQTGLTGLDIGPDQEAGVENAAMMNV